MDSLSPVDETDPVRRHRLLPADLRAGLLRLVRERGLTRHAEPFTLSSGGSSHDYVDLRRAVARGDDLRLAAEAVIAALESTGTRFDAIGGMTMGADPVAHAVALLTSTAWFSVRKAEKAHGSRRRIEGAELTRASRVVLFEDTVTTGRSLVEALDVVVESGAKVVLACTLLDRGEAAAAVVATRSTPYLALLRYDDIGIDPITPARSEGTSPAGGDGMQTG
jgi:orotate phosphoribosyltransferase